MTRKTHKISRKIAVAVALIVLAATALIAANGGWHTPVGHSANGGWRHAPVQAGYGGGWR